MNTTNDNGPTRPARASWIVLLITIAIYIIITYIA